jgi:hypothetical protein
MLRRLVGLQAGWKAGGIRLLDEQKTVFEGASVIVRTLIDMPGDAVIITFTSRREQPKPTRAGFGVAFFAKRRIPAVHIISLQNHWWQTPDMAQALAAIDDLRLGERFSGITTYGSSMGAHGALVFSGRLQAHRVLAFSPQFALNGRGAAWNSHWATETKELQELHRFEDGCSRTAEIVVAADPLRSFDMLHVDAMRRERTITFLPIPFGAHPPMRYLSDRGLLTPLVEGMVAGGLDIARFRQRIRAERRRNLSHLLGLARMLHKRGGKAPCRAVLQLACAEIEGRLDRGEGFASVVEAAQLIRMAANAHLLDPAGAIALLGRLRQSAPASPQIEAAMAQLHAAANQPEEAIIAARRAVSLKRSNLDLRLGLARALYAAGRDEEAAGVVASSMTARSRGKESWGRFLAEYRARLDDSLIQAIHNKIA